ncbi:hypothetical protein [Pseudonocardia sp. ICBG601]|uniref:hypothetical protein n=1 Tax=Pseudonocardia sp. ICBG601 TaxID=2846759 RepID=UPI001CF64DD8|nr:hypothetical protein [Pseudonocardia sp. ICBG601]
MVEAFFLTCVVVAFFVTKGRTDTAAYSNGKEPPGLARARMRHENAGGARTSSGRPTGRGAFGLLVASRWAEACRAAQHRGEHRAARRRAWFDETAPGRDERWRAVQQRRMERADRARARWAQARGLHPASTSDSGAVGGVAGPAGAPAPQPWGRRRARPTADAAGAAGTTVTAPDDPGLPTPDSADSADSADGVGVEVRGADPEPGTGSAPASPTGPSPAADLPPDTTTPNASTGTSSSSSGGDGMYEAAVARLIAAADACGVYQTQLAAFTDRLAGDGWGDQVTGPLGDSLSGLNAAEGLYRGLAEQMRSQGDRGRDAYDQAPYVPGPHAVL